MQVREEEMEEMDNLHAQVELLVKGGLGDKAGKTNVLMQAYISRLPVKAFALTSDMMFISQSASRIARGVFEIALSRGWISYAEKALRLSKAIERRMWPMQTPIRQIGGQREDIYQKVEAKRADANTLREMAVGEIGQLVTNQRAAHGIKAEVEMLPHLTIDVVPQPITRTVLKVTLTLTAELVT